MGYKEPKSLIVPQSLLDKIEQRMDQAIREKFIPSGEVKHAVETFNPPPMKLPSEIFDDPYLDANSDPTKPHGSYEIVSRLQGQGGEWTGVHLLDRSGKFIQGGWFPGHITALSNLTDEELKIAANADWSKVKLAEPATEQIGPFLPIIEAVKIFTTLSETRKHRFDRESDEYTPSPRELTPIEKAEDSLYLLLLHRLTFDGSVGPITVKVGNPVPQPGDGV